MTNKNTQLLKDFDFATIDRFDYYLKTNKTLDKYLQENNQLNKPLKLSTKDESLIKHKRREDYVRDIFYSYFSTEGVVIKLRELFDLVPSLNNYSDPVGTSRKIILNEQFLKIKFFGLEKAKASILSKYNKFLKENGRENKKLNCYSGKSAVYKTLFIGNILKVDSNKDISNSTERESLIDNLYVEFPIPRDIVKAIKAYYLTLANASANNKEKENIDFSDFCSQSDYLDKYITTKLTKELTYPEVVVFRQVLSAKYQLLKEHVIKSCDYLLKLVPQAYKAINIADEAIVKEKVEDLSITLSYGLSFITRGVNDYTGTHKAFKQFLEPEHLEFFEDCSVNQLIGVLNNKVTQPNVDSKIYRMSPFKNFSRAFYNYAKKTKVYTEYFDNSTGINIALRRSSTHVLQNLRRIISTNLLQRAVSNNERITLYLDSTLIESTAKLIDNCGFTFSKTRGFANCFKITLLQTESKIPIIFESGDGIVPDVRTLPDLLKNLDRISLNNSNLLLCGDKGYFSEENLATLEALDFKYCFMAKDVKMIVSSAQKYRLGQWIKHYNQEYELNTILDTLSYRDYINLDKSYRPLLEKHVQDSKPGFTLASIQNRKINILHTLSSKDLQASFDRLCQKTYTFYHENKDQIFTEKDLKATKDPTAELFYINEKDELDYDYDAIEKKLPVNALFTIITNDLTLSDVDMINTYRGRMYIESSFSRVKSYQDMSSFCKHLNETAEMKNFINWNTLIIYNTLEHLLNTPITGTSTRDKSREKSRQYLFKETRGNVDKLLVLAIKSFQVTFVGTKTKPIYKDLNKQAKAIVDLLDMEQPEIYKDVGFIESSSRIISKIKNKSNPKSSKDDQDNVKNHILKSMVIDY